MFENIKASTHDAHITLEKILIKRLKAVNSKADYFNILDVFYKFCQTVEPQMETYIDSAVIPDLKERQKLSKLKDDIEGLGYRCQDKITPLFRLSSLSQALGMMYVLEGSTLGGKIIAAMMAQHHPQLAAYCSYFKSYGDNAPAMWLRFKDYVLESQHLVDESTMIAGAQQAFETMYLMFEEPTK